jgi:hypothetical protein
MTEEKEKPELTPDSSINEIFEAIELGANGGCNVRPVSLQQDDDDTRLCLFVRGTHSMASFVFAEVMSKVQDLFDLQAQADARAAADAEKPRIVSGR